MDKILRHTKCQYKTCIINFQIKLGTNKAQNLNNMININDLCKRLVLVSSSISSREKNLKSASQLFEDGGGKLRLHAESVGEAGGEGLTAWSVYWLEQL